jgi:hypothetical protein
MSSASSSQSGSKLVFEIEALIAETQKAKAEREKTQLEIEELKAWYRRPVFLQPVAAIVFATATALVGWANGWFSIKLEALNNKQFEVSREIERLEGSRSQLNRQIENLQRERVELRTRLELSGAESRRLALEVKSLQQQNLDAGKYKADLSRLQEALGDTARRAIQVASQGPQITLLDGTTVPLRRVYGHVLTYKDQPLPDVTVELSIPTDEKVTHLLTTMTRSDGSFQIDLDLDTLLYDPISLTFVKEGYQTLTLKPVPNLIVGTMKHPGNVGVVRLHKL